MEAANLQISVVFVVKKLALLLTELMIKGAFGQESSV